jgi:hypothetical protein
MDIHLYQYTCYKWWRTYSGLRNLNTGDVDIYEIKVKEIAREDAMKYTGSNNCNINLLHQFKVSLNSVKNYSDITNIPFTQNVHLSEKKESD